MISRRTCPARSGITLTDCRLVANRNQVNRKPAGIAPSGCLYETSLPKVLLFHLLLTDQNQRGAEGRSRASDHMASLHVAANAARIERNGHLPA